MTRNLVILAMAALVLGSAIAGRDQAEAGGGLDVSILSGAPDMVSGGDALVRVDVPGSVPLEQVRVELNGDDVTAAFAPEPGDYALVGLLDGFALGDNTLRAKVTGPARPCSR
ncbi:hypothetical protein LCGC14_2722110 [marine sediment metagenome]|uniref:DUF6351 domain-containing protein n=1 Tax=marine sediment metagenome TaxID=412755 RepID=A0A0F8Z9X1_9ZZZZ